jgi:hypothetical protein
VSLHRSSPRRARQRALAAVLAVASAGADPTAAFAQSAKDVAAARQAFKEGEEAEARGDLAIAVQKYQRALSLKETPQLYLRIGAVEEKAGRLVEALASYESGLSKATSLPAVAKVAREQIDAVKPRVPIVTVVASSPPPDLIVTLDGAPVAPSALGGELRVDPGTHRVHAQAPGWLPRDQTFSAVERGRARVELGMMQVDPAQGRAAEAPPPDAPSRAPGGVLVGVGGAVLVVGAALLADSFVKDSAIDKLCGSSARTMCPAADQSSILSDVNTVNGFRFGGIAAMAAGAAGTIAGIYLLARKQASAPAALVVAPAVSSDVRGLVVLGRF